MTASARPKAALRGLFIAVTVGLLVWALIGEWGKFTAALRNVSAMGVIGAAIAVAVGLVFNMLSWRESIAAVAHPLPLRSAAHVYFVSQLGKYVPGSVWPVVAQTEMGRAHGISRTRSAIGSILAMLIGLATSVLVASSVLLVLRREALARYWWLGVVAIGCVIALSPPVLRRLLPLATRLRARGAEPAQLSVATPRLLRAYGWGMLLWPVYGMQAWLIARDLAPHASNLFAWSVGAFALAWAVGFVIVLAPGGLGAREIALTFALSTVMSHTDALALALISRVLMTIGDLTAAAAAVVLHRGPE